MPDSYRRVGGPDMRLSDAERQEMADILGKHFADGRLDEEEFHERLNRAMAARTQSQLGGLLDDLPRLGAESEPAAARPRRRHVRGRVLLAALLAVMVVSTLDAVLWPTHFPWVLLLVGAYLILRNRRWHHGYRCRA